MTAAKQHGIYQPNSTRRRQGLAVGIHWLFFALVWMLGSNALAAEAGNVLEGIDFAGLPGNRVQVTMTMSGPAPEPLSFTIDNPARIAFDLPNTRSALAKRAQAIGVGVAKSITAIEAQGRTRVVLNLVELVPYETRAEGNKIVVTLQDSGASATPMAASSPPVAPSGAGAAPSAGASLLNVDFRRGELGEGRIVVTLSDPSIPVDMRQEGGKVVLDFYDTQLPEQLARRLDVLDFATPVKTIDTFTRGNNVRMSIEAFGEYDHLAYQSEDEFTVEIKPTTKEEQEARRKEEFGYTGERLSLNFQDIEVRSVLQLIADFTGTNIVVSDTVGGSLTLRLKNVPWDQALDIILKTKGLAKRQSGNVMLVAPSEEIAAREKLELESQKQIEELAPLYSEFVQINYAKASDIAGLLQGSEASLMSERGNVTVDERTNTLLIQDTAEKLEEIRKLVSRLDIPVRQVLIESRVVIAGTDFARELGVKFGLSNTDVDGRNFNVIAGSQPGDLAIGGGPIGIENPPGSGNDSLVVDLAAPNAVGGLNLLTGKIGSHLLRLELTAMQMEGRGEVVSSPRVITSNQQEAIIRQGVEIPYQEASSSGATSVSFKEAVLALRVTPQITPDDRIIMDVQVNKDSVGEVFAGVPSIDTREVTTQVLVDNGETLVLGGIYEQEVIDQTEKLPFFGDLPGVGWMFRNKVQQDDRQELLIFVTPRIVKESLTL
jgi:type IV pilus assembly protein PilQ